MHFNTDSVIDIKSFFQNNLSSLYSKQEIDSFFYLLIEHYALVSKIDLINNPSLKLNSTVCSQMKAAYNDLQNQKPIQYITGRSFFFDLKLHVEPGVLIPRPETEMLVDSIIKRNQHFNSIIDIGTGSGCIAIQLKKSFPKAQVVAVDVSEFALEIAKKNALENNAPIHFINHDILSTDEFTSENTLFDLIVSNPPYVKISEKKFMQNHVLDFEPKEALFVPDENPLIFYNAIADFAVKRLNTNGKLFFEINENHGKEIVILLTNKGFKDLKLMQDLNNKDRFISCGI